MQVVFLYPGFQHLFDHQIQCVFAESYVLESNGYLFRLAFASGKWCKRIATQNGQ